MVDKIDPTNLSSVEYGSQLLQQKQRRDEEYAKKVRKDQKINNWLTGISTFDNILKNRAVRNVNERITSSAPIVAREKAEIAAFNKEYDAQAGFREAERSGLGLELYAQQLADTELKQGAYQNITSLAALKELQDPLYNKFVAQRDALAKYKVQQYKANKLSKRIVEEEYLQNIKDWTKKPEDAGILHEAAKFFKLKDRPKAEVALSDLLDPNGIKYSEELLKNPVGYNELINAKDENGNPIWNEDEREALRSSVTEIVADKKKLKEVDDKITIRNAFGTEITAISRTTTTSGPYETKSTIQLITPNGIATNIDAAGNPIPRNSKEVNMAAEQLIAKISNDMPELSAMQMWTEFQKQDYNLFSQLQQFKSSLLPKPFTASTVTDNDKTDAKSAIENYFAIMSRKNNNLKDISEYFLSLNRRTGDPDIDSRQQITLNSFVTNVAKSHEYYTTRLKKDVTEAYGLAIQEQLEGMQQIITEGSFGRVKGNYFYTAKQPGSLGNPNPTPMTPKESSVPDNKTVTDTTGRGETFTTGTAEDRLSKVESFKGNSNFMNVYRTSSFIEKQKMLDSAARNSQDQTRVTMEDFVELGESVRLLDGNGYLSWNGTQFEQSGVVAVLGALEGTGKELTFSSVPEGEIKDLVREKAVDIYKTFSKEYPETVANPELLFKYRAPANAVNSLVDAAGFSLFGATRGDTTTIQKFILDALKDALPQLEDRQIYASL